ncbi:MAG: nucleotidyltransferase domain-containing protein [Synechococcales cyanobacterium K44_A2020_017]|jgi:predicted nucleotidyltransferase|uniref:nucleotidyltransferase family protein n=1 Tax=Leptolyngbya sp. CCY15150 TaxID=2767772 RepID=UPI00194E9CAE|nr:nucleotidyltransferase domain-containing protein [Leptolyngbya sp. CCY15150]MBF2087623.1 nucleotidyltransferase domain-containing protein [Synechococcales cyanobacterium K32_A2020_035]MBF2096244.1 nucleotidyltransferase domain-containing protein [Synechococcales cyanobacterium K44_A2020_017]
MTNKTGLGIKELLYDRRSQILAIAEKHGAYNVRVFGSVARGEATDKSDIDFLVDYDLENITPWFPGGLLLDLEQLLNRKVDIATVDMLKEQIRDRVLHEAVTL